MRSRRFLVTVLIMIATAFALAGCTGDDGPDQGSTRLQVDGVAAVTLPDGEETEVAGREDVPFGAVVRMTAGTATMEMASGARYELRTDGSDPTEVEVAIIPVLVAGDILISDGFPASVRHDLATVSARGALQVSADGPIAKIYAGLATVTGVGSLDEVAGLRQVLLTPAATPDPIVFVPTDAWDRRYLGEAAAFGDRLESFSRGYTNDIQPAPTRSVPFFETVVAGLAQEREFEVDMLDPDREIGETLVGASIAVASREGTFRERWDAIFAFRDEGANWGIVALSQGVSSTTLLETIELAIGTSPMSDDPRETPTTVAPPSTASPTTVPRGSTSAPPTTAPPTSSPPSTTEPEDGLLTPLLDPLAEILSDLLGILGLG